MHRRFVQVTQRLGAQGSSNVGCSISSSRVDALHMKYPRPPMPCMPLMSAFLLEVLRLQILHPSLSLRRATPSVDQSTPDLSGSAISCGDLRWISAPPGCFPAISNSLSTKTTRQPLLSMSRLVPCQSCLCRSSSILERVWDEPASRVSSQPRATASYLDQVRSRCIL